jgi:hypothetical protein
MNGYVEKCRVTWQTALCLYVEGYKNSFREQSQRKLQCRVLTSTTTYILESFRSILLCIDRIYVSDIMPPKHNPLPSTIYMVIRLQCFDPLLDHHQAHIKQDSVLHFIFYVPNGILCSLQGCIQFVKGATKNWRVECSNTQHISCPVCPKFLVEFGVRSWWTYELWLLLVEL